MVELQLFRLCMGPYENDFCNPYTNNRTCLSFDNSAMVTRREACDMSKVLECCKKNNKFA